MNIATVVYIHVPGDKPHEYYATRYVESVLSTSNQHIHNNLILCQGSMPTDDMKAVFLMLGRCRFVVHSDQGWDIGGYVRAATVLHDEMPSRPMICMGGNSSVIMNGWLDRLMDVWKNEGPGIYGTLSSYQARPHLNTTGFMCLPEHLLRYPKTVISKEDRYEFEHGPGCWWYRMAKEDQRVRLVTWDGVYDWKQWRSPPNISCRGDQTNCLTHFRINYDYRDGDDQNRANLELLSDSLTDPEFKSML